MKNYLIILLACLIPVSAISGESVSVPWQEFKTLYKESIEQSVRKSDEKEPFHVSFRESDYTIHLKSVGGSGTAVITGNVISGKPEPVPLFSSDIIIKEISEVTGGALSCARNAGAGIVFHPSGTEPFRIRLSFFIPVQEDNRSRFLSMEIPKALKNSLNLKQPTDIIVTEVPGVNEGNGLYRFPPDDKLSVRFAKKNEVDARNTSHHEQLEKEYRAVSTPSVVLDSTSFFTSFEENGSILSVLVMDVPPEAGSHLTLAAVPGASIWSLRVNGEKMKVYENNGKEPAWIVPLSIGRGVAQPG